MKGGFNFTFWKTKGSGICSWCNVASFRGISPTMFFAWCRYNLTFRVSGFVALAVAELLGNGYIFGQKAPPIYDTPLTVVEGEKLRLVIDLRHVINYFVKLFSIIITNLIGKPCSLCEWRGFVNRLTLFLWLSVSDLKKQTKQNKNKNSG